MSLTSQGSNNSGELSHQRTHSNSSNLDKISPFYKYVPNHPITGYANLENLKTYNVLEQEQLIVEDLLTLLYGLDGNYISLEQVSTQLDQVTDLDASQSALVKRILPGVKYVKNVDMFIERLSYFEAGLINQALACAVSGLLKEYYLLLAQLETKLRTGDLGLNQFWFHFSPTLNTFCTLSNLIDQFSSWGGSKFSKGGASLDILYTTMTLNSGDPESSQLYHYLLKAAWKPFLTQLSHWIHRGEIVDPYQEFMIKEKYLNKSILSVDFNEAYWQQRYTIRTSMMPRFLVKYSDKILNAGKYWNVLKECNSLASSSLSNKAGADFAVNDIQGYYKMVDEAYIDANRSFLAFLFKDKALISKLNALKRYFFLEQSDFFTHFLDLASEELDKPADQVTVTKLQSLLELTLRNPASVTYYDPNKEDILVSLKHLRLVDHIRKIVATEGIHTIDSNKAMAVEIDPELDKAFEKLGEDISTQYQLTGANTLTLDYNTQFPYSLVISRKSLTKYQLLFRMLLQLKFVEQQLQKAWSDHTIWRRPKPNLGKLNTRLSSVATSNGSYDGLWYGTVHRLRHAMLNMVQAVHYYVSVEVLEPNCQRLLEKLSTVQTADQVFEIHTSFLDTCLKSAMLTNSKLVGIYHKLLMTCEKLTGLVNSSSGDAKSKAGSILQIEEDFQFHLQNLVKALQFYGTVYCPTYLNLVTRVDFNGYYTGLGFKK